MCIEHVGVGSAAIRSIVGSGAGCQLELFAHEFISVIAIVKASPKIDLPGLGPSGPTIAPKLKGFLDGSGEFGRLFDGDLLSGKEGK